jgi:predicted MFS family arabinose efflux permease
MPTSSRLPRGHVRLMALICAITVANLYYAQPLLHAIASALKVSQASAGLIVTATQLGYAAGLLFVVPTGDIARRRRVMVILLSAGAVVMAATAVTTSLALMAALAVLIGCTSVVVQMIIPFAASLAREDERAGVIGTILGGLLFGILLSRTFSGLLASIGGWRAVYAAGAVLTAGTIALLFRVLPDAPADLSIGYRQQMRGVLRIARREPILRWRSAIGACVFAAFSAFWTTATFLLAGPRYHYPEWGIALFALVGAAGASASMFGGRFIDRRQSRRWIITGVLVLLLALSFVPLWLGGDHGIGWLIVGALLMDACVQAPHLLNQSVVYGLVPEARSRIATVYMTTYFVGGAAGSAIATMAFHRWGWNGSMAAAGLLAALGLLPWLATYRHEHAAGLLADTDVRILTSDEPTPTAVAPDTDAMCR